ncbi:uncharacterized protein BXIN_0783 [Babesia sp. Xinjiang]|uniref:uncharacterized protein n=1 Tax=Babesia sp. Xinjiang TaxID=462227 RepID=UPI000A249BD5|nr:uncharacterized protein BXIN_0783 [Babesia sp. Xinjiang]ORM41345.1 hypothetical protein BXIN_0783 [Babesia sp. Xinjiang]
MSKSLAAFLDRRKKSTVKAAALLQQTEEAAALKQKALDGADDAVTEVQSEHDDEWKVSDDEDVKAFKNQTTFSGSLLKSVRTVAGEGLEDRGPRQEAKPAQHVWKTINEPLEKKEPPKEEAPKVWVPKYKSGGLGGGLLSKNDVDLAEAVRVAEAKAEHHHARKTKTLKKKAASSRPDADPDITSFVKIKFNVFSVMPESYRSFKSPHPNTSLNVDSVKAKYIARTSST